MTINEQAVQQFRETVWEYYARFGRHDLPWRQPGGDGDFDSYRILVSEIMLQQTQVARVIPKFLAFLTTFPDLAGLARAELGDVLRMWSGLGYNRRAKFLWQTAAIVRDAYHGELPRTVGELTRLPGIGFIRPLSQPHRVSLR